MTPKEKAHALVYRFRQLETDISLDGGFEFECLSHRDAVYCAGITVDEIITQWVYIDTYLADGGGELNPNLKYWQGVKQELEKL